jgi:hypothetical protein
MATRGGDWLDNMLDESLADGNRVFVEVVEICLVYCTDSIKVMLADGASWFAWFGCGGQNGEDLIDNVLV